jgi:integrase/recombinase XerD
MARTTIPSAVRVYLDAMRPYLSEGTLVRKARNLRTIARDLKTSVAPSKLGDGEIECLLLAWRSRGLDAATQAKYLVDLDGFLAWNGNAAITNLRKNKHVRLPRPVSKPVRVLDDAEIGRLRVAAESIEGWPGDVARFLVAFLPATGLRRKEIRLARLKDVDLTKGRILVSHPKGEGSWAAPDFGPVPVYVRPILEDFLEARRAYLDGTDSEWLVPYRRVSGEIGPWSDPVFGWLKSELARRSGVVFSLKTFRATFAQNAKDRGAPIEAVSRALRHASTHTTEAYYARIRADDAFAEIERAFARPLLRVE